MLVQYLCILVGLLSIHQGSKQCMASTDAIIPPPGLVRCRVSPCIRLRGGGGLSLPFIHISNPFEAFSKRRRARNQSTPVLENQKSGARAKDTISEEDRSLLEAIKSLNDEECAHAVSELIERGARVRYYSGGN
jgi:hypothetical protein